MSDEETLILVTLDRPEHRYAVQHAFISEGAFPINPETGQIIKGVLNLPSICLTTNGTNGDSPKKPAFGFLLEPHSEKPASKTEPVVEAILHFVYNDGEYSAGFNEKDGTLSLLLQVLNDSDVDKWGDIALKVGSKFVEQDDEGKLHPLITFTLTSLFIPGSDDLDSLRQAVLGHALGNSGNLADAVSSDYAFTGEEEYYDEEEGEDDQ